MGWIYVAKSAELGKWGADVGLGKTLFKVGYSEDEPAEMVKAAQWGGESDWSMMKAEPAEDVTDEQIIERVAVREKMVDPNYYPRLKGQQGIFKVRRETIEKHVLLKEALDGKKQLSLKIKQGDFANYLLGLAQKAQ